VSPEWEENIYLIDRWLGLFITEKWREYSNPEGFTMTDATDREIHVTTEHGTEKVLRSNVFPPGWEMIRELLYGYYDARSNREDEEEEGEL